MVATFPTSDLPRHNTAVTSPVVDVPVDKSMLPCVSLNTDTYQSLKSQVQLLKSEHKQVLGVHKTAKQVFNSSLLLISICAVCTALPKL